MSGNRLLWMLWLIIAVAHALRNVVALAAGQNASVEVEPMLLALVLVKLYEKDGEDE